MPTNYQLNCLRFYNGARMPIDPGSAAEEAGKAIADIPLWVWVVVSLAGMSGETWRASLEPEIKWQEVVRRVALRTGACALFGMATYLIATATGTHPGGAAGLAIICGLIGADSASALYERYVAKKLGIKKPSRED